jgi:hypothetical protein
MTRDELLLAMTDDELATATKSMESMLTDPHLAPDARARVETALLAARRTAAKRANEK